MSDDVIRLDFESNLSKATAQTDRFIANIEKKFKALGRQLETALQSGIVDSSNSKEIQKLRQELNRLEKELNDVKKASSNTGQSISKIGVAFSALAGVIAGLGLARIASGFANLAKDAFLATGALEQTELALKSLTARELVQTGQFNDLREAFENSDEIAQDLIDTLFELARTSPFSRQQILDAFRLAQAYGFTREEALRLTQATVDLAAGTGQSAEVIGRIALAFGQIQARGTLAGQELRQLQEAGFAAGDVLADLGFTLEDVSKGLVDADVFLAAAAERIEADFGGAAARATNTIQGLSSTLGDLKADALIAFFRPAIEQLQPIVADLAGSFDELQPAIGEAGQAFSELVKVIIENAPDAALAIGVLTRSFNGLSEIAESESVQNIINVLLGFTGAFERQSQDLIENNLRSAKSVEELQNEFENIISLQDELRFVDVFGEDLLPTAAKETATQLALQADSVGDFILLLREFDEVRRETGGREELSPFTITGEDVQSQVAFFENTRKQAEETRKLEEETRKLAETRNIAKREQIEQGEIEETALRRKEELSQITSQQAESHRELVIELVKSSDSADKNAIAIFNQAEAAGASSAQLEDLSITLGILTPQQIAAKQESDLLTQSFIDGEIGSVEYKARLQELNAEIAGTASNAVGAASSINILTDAFKQATSPSRRRSRGGGRGRDTSSQREVDELEKQAKAIEDSAKNFADLVLEIAEADKQLAEAREELNKAISEGASEDELEGLRSKISELEQGTSDWESSLFKLTQEAGASIETLAQLGVATGQFTQEQADAAIASINRERGLRAIAKALAEQSISTEDATSAAEELNRQLAEGEDVDLTAFGIDVSQVDTEAVPALLKESAQAAREAAQALTQIAGALGGVADESETLSQAILKQTATQAINEAETLDQKLAALELAVAFGTLTKAQADSLAQLALLEELQKTAILNNAQYAEVLRLVADEGLTVEEALTRIGVSLDEIPEELRVEIDTNKDEVLNDINELDDKLNELDGKEVKVNVKVDVQDVTAEVGGEAIGAGGLTEADFSGQSGGFTGRGNPSDIAGIVHREELVIPQKVLKGGVPAIASFAANNVPNFRDSVSLSNTSPVQNTVVPNSTIINNTTSSGDTINNSNASREGDTINFYGVEGERIARSVFNTSNYNRQNKIMKRNSQVNALF